MRFCLLVLVLSACGDDATGGAMDAGRGGTDAGRRGDGGAPADAARADGATRDAGPDRDGGPTGPRYDEVVFMATHNSYSGGARGSIPHQLDVGVRFVELDVHDNDYATTGYRVGHDAPGNQVAFGGGNPSGAALGDWLAAVSDWSSAHPAHAPITIGLDLKDDLTDNARFGEGNLAAMNALLESAFGDRLFGPDDASAGFPAVDAMRDRVLIVLSGDQGSRIAYVRDAGQSPAVAVNARGQVLEVHGSGSGALWYWAGELLSGGHVRWHRHGRYDSGRAPAVAMNDAGDIVEVHQSESATTLWYHVAHMGDDHEIAWGPSRMYDDGVTPTIRFVTGSSTMLREVHRSEGSAQNWFWDATLDAASDSVSFGAHDRTSDPLFTKTEDGGVRVFTGPDGDAPSDTLQYATAEVPSARIRFVPVAFVEMQEGNDPDLGRRFYAAASGHHASARAWRAAGGVVRLWQFDEGDTVLDPPVQLPATDTPEASFYLDFADRVSAYER